MKKEDLKEQLISNSDEIVNIISKGNTAEIKASKDGIVILDVSKKKLKKSLDYIK